MQHFPVVSRLWNVWCVSFCSRIHIKNEKTQTPSACDINGMNTFLDQLRAGADTGMRNGDGETAMDLCGDESAAEALRNA